MNHRDAYRKDSGEPHLDPRAIKVLIALGLVFAEASCMTTSRWNTARGPIPNPIFVSANSADLNSELAVTERAVDVLHKYNFEIDNMNQVEGTIATRYKVGASVLEPWHKDSVGSTNRWESTFQPIRRKVLLHIVRAPGGYLVSLEALKELEDMTSPSPNSAGGSTFIEDYPLRRDLNLVLGQSSPSGWVPLGHDLALEQDMLCRLQTAFSTR